MNLDHAISFNELLAGGPGSGCNGPNCGRPRKPDSGIAEGDTVKLKTSVKMYNQKTGNNDSFGPGTKATVINVLPKVGNADQMISVVVKKTHDPEYVAMKDVELHQTPHTGLPMWTRPWFKDPQDPAWKKLDVQPVPKSQIIQKATLPDGAKLTWVRPQEEAERSPQTLKEIADEPSRFKGKFYFVEKVGGADGQNTYYYDTHPVSKNYQQETSGSALWVHRYPNKVVIQEQPTYAYSQKSRGLMTFEYKNVGQAFGMLKQRYGISIEFKKMGRF